MTTTLERIHESAADTAKKIRKELKLAFPESKFSVTSKTYSMGSSITAAWKGGQEPDHEAAEKLVRRFSGKSFDGMTDSSTYHGYEYDGKIYYGADYIFYRKDC